MKKSIKLLVAIVGVFVVLVGGAYAWGASLPRDHSASVSRSLPVPPARVYALLTDHAGGVNWRPGLHGVEALPPVDGHARWREDSEWGVMTYEEVEAIPDQLYVARIADTSQGFGGTWTYALEPVDGGTRLTITEDGFVDDPLFRLVSAHVIGHDATMREVMRALAKHLGADTSG
jgi:uncharacterized protein YndB with AHSA1/START domain